MTFPATQPITFQRVIVMFLIEGSFIFQKAHDIEKFLHVLPGLMFPFEVLSKRR